jgi:hypothetical protein
MECLALLSSVSGMVASLLAPASTFAQRASIVYPTLEQPAALRVQMQRAAQETMSKKPQHVPQLTAPLARYPRPDKVTIKFRLMV